LASWLWEEGVFKPREGDTVVLAAEPLRRRRIGRRAAAAALTACAAGLGFVATLPGHPLRDLAARADPRESARVEFATDQRLRVAIDGAAPIGVEPGDARELAPGKHHLVFEWPSGASDAVDVELAAGEKRSVRPERSAGR